MDYRDVFQAHPDPCLLLDRDLTIVEVNAAYLRATRLTRDIVGRGLFEVFPDDPGEERESGLRASLVRVLALGGPDKLAPRRRDVRRADGGAEERWWTGCNTPILDAEGKTAFILHRVVDVTESVRSESHRRSAEEERERAARLKELDRLKTEFVANVSHELRTPLALILGPLEQLLAAPRLGLERRRALETAAGNARLLLKHIDDLLEVSNLDAGRTGLRRQEADLAALARLVAASFEGAAREKGLSLEVSAPVAIRASFDEGKMRRVLRNLLSNAVKFTPAGGRVRLSAGRDGEEALLEVADSGPGIPLELREAAFERFRQLDGGPSRLHGGTGLGLAVAREFVVLHGGSLTVDAAPEGGARFAVRLPLDALADAGPSPSQPGPADGEPEAAEPDSRAEQPSLPLREGQGPLVLVIEDNREMNRFLSRSMPRGCRTVSAHDGGEGIEKALTLRPDLVLCDVMMPGASGEEVLRVLRSREEFDRVPVVILSARVDEALRTRLLRGGAQDFIAKPFSLGELQARVSNLLERRKSEQSAIASEKAQREFSANVSHDLRTPVSIIKGCAEALSKEEDEKERRWYIRTIVGNAERLAVLVDDVLTISSLEAGSMESRPERVDLKRALDDYAREIAPLLRRAHVELQLRVPPRTAAWADPRHLQKVLANLVTNAVKYNRKGGWVRVAAEARDGKLRVAVKDSGIGIPAEHLPRVFERFYRVDKSRPKEKGDSGLGLSIVKRILCASGNDIQVRSAAGKGTTFEFTLDLPPGERAGTPRRGRAARAPSLSS